MNPSEELGTAPVGVLLRKQAIPAAIGILTLSINGIVDNIFVGQNVGSVGIGAITVVLPITFLIASIGMSIGVGGASVISRALGADKADRAHLTFGNQTTLTLGFSILFVILGYFFQDELLNLFGGKGNILEYARIYFNILLPSIPFLAFAMMSNNVIRAEGRPKVSMAI
jgi:Na+-driven multidrug efflux pump